MVICLFFNLNSKLCVDLHIYYIYKRKKHAETLSCLIINIICINSHKGQFLLKVPLPSVFITICFHIKSKDLSLGIFKYISLTHLLDRQPFIATLQELEDTSLLEFIPSWAYVSTSARFRLPTFTTTSHRCTSSLLKSKYVLFTIDFTISSFCPFVTDLEHILRSCL